MKKLLCALLVTVPLIARADLFGSDTAVLTQILSENVQQLMQLENLLSNGQSHLELLREINQGINDSMMMMQTVSPYLDKGQFADIRSVADATRRFASIYGTVVESPDAKSQRSVDTAVAEAVTMNNQIYDYTAEIDRVGEQIKSYSHSVSPGGAAKLTAESLGVMLHVLNQQLRAQGTLLKLQAQGIAQANKREKDHTAEYLRSAGDISDALENSDPKFKQPRF